MDAESRSGLWALHRAMVRRLMAIVNDRVPCGIHENCIARVFAQSNSFQAKTAFMLGKNIIKLPYQLSLIIARSPNKTRLSAKS
jgi:hypothetical protein